MRIVNSDKIGDDVLMARCGRGDQAAFQTLYERYYRMVYNLAFRMLGNHADAEEVTPEVFIKVWQKAADFRGQSRVSTWMYRVAANMALDRLRSARVTREVFWDDLTPVEKEMPGGEASETPEQALLRTESQRALAAALARLAAEDRLLVTLYHLQGLTYAEIEEVTGITPANIKSKLFRARRRLRGHLQVEHMDILETTPKGDAPDEMRRSTDTADGLCLAEAPGR